MSSLSISVIIPTFQRPDGLLVAARSIFAQTMLAKTEVTLIIVDNDPAASAAASIETLRAEAPEALIFKSAHEPRAGVANARNCATDMVTSDLIAFLDDDQAARDPDWLETLYKLHCELKPAVVFGPLITVLPDDVHRHRDYFSQFFGRHDPSPRGFISDFHGGCNTLIDVASLPPERPLFNPETNATGGEDDMLFLAIAARGGRFAWEPNAAVLEHVVRKRITLKYTLKRAFVYGQGPTTEARIKGNYVKLIMWMGIGALKFGYYGLLGGVSYLFGRDTSAKHTDEAIRGLSKVLFWKRFELYGQAALNPNLLTPAPLDPPELDHGNEVPVRSD